MHLITQEHHQDARKSDTRCQKTAGLNKLFLGRVYSFLVFICVFPELSLSASVAGSKVEHPGLCPNKLNNNLWVDAQSTCERECNVDEVNVNILIIPNSLRKSCFVCCFLPFFFFIVAFTYFYVFNK